jgi:hypothetical protein
MLKNPGKENGGREVAQCGLLHFSLRRHYPDQVKRVLSQSRFLKSEHPGNSDDEKEHLLEAKIREFKNILRNV